MYLEKIDAQKKAFTLKFADDEVFSVQFGADAYGYKEMRVIVDKKDAENNLIESFTIGYTWNPSLGETPSFALDMMELLKNLGKKQGEKNDTSVPQS